MKKYAFRLFRISLLTFLGVFSVSAQYSLEAALNDARENSSTLKLNSLEGEIGELTSDNISTVYYPKLGITGQATYQSAVTELPIEIPGIEIDGLSKDQYKIQAELRQLIYDGGASQNLKDLNELSIDFNEAKNELEFEKIRELVLTSYFSILELQSKKEILKYKQATLESNLKTIESGVRNGIILQSDMYELQAAIISVQQEGDKIQSYKESVIRTLGILTGKNIDPEEEFPVPQLVDSQSTSIKEKAIFNQMDIQKELILKNQKLNETNSIPKASLFVNGGYGRPALNFLSNTFEPYFIGGVRVSWSLNNLYTKSKERQIVQLSGELIDERKDMIMDNLNTQKIRYEGEIELNRSLLTSDEEILELRKKIRETGESQLQNGTITSNKLIPYINSENEVMESIALRKLQIIKNQYLLQHLTGNYSK